MERMRFADFHMDRLNPFLEEILGNPEFRYAVARKKQIPSEGLNKLDLFFASIYRRATEEIRTGAKSGDENILSSVRREHEKIIDYYNTAANFHVINKPEDLHLEPSGYDANNVVLHLEGGDTISNPDIVDGLYESGVRSVGLLYNHDNLLGGGAKGDTARGITPLGKRVVDRMLEKGMVIDIAHANRRTTNDILERVGDYPKAVATHTALGNAERHLSPELLKKIAAGGGVVGYTAAKPMFSSFSDYINAYRNSRDLLGSADNLAIGSDFGGLDAQDLFSEFDEIGKLSKVAEALSEKANFSDADVEKIMYGNVERIVKQLS